LLALTDAPLTARLQGKVAIIAADHPGNQDLHHTPYGEMNGAEIQAQIVETLISGRYPIATPLWINLMAALGFVLMARPLFQRLSPWYGALLLPLFLLAISAMAYDAFLHDRRLTPTLGQLSIILVYLGSVATRLTRQERARRHIYNLLCRYVPEPVARRITKSGRLPILGGETVTATILFSDIRGFTTLSERLNPAEVVELLNHYFSEACGIVIQNGGAIDKYIGDALMAVFGAPEPFHDHARRALDTAEQLVQKAQQFDAWMQQRFPDRGLAPFRIGIGLHTGPVVAGNIGAPMRMEYTVIGDTVNVSSRLEGQCNILNWPIVASQATLQAAGVEEGFTQWEKIYVKGRHEPITVGQWHSARGVVK
jgi:class 3 adenylate cyclase